MICLLCDVLGSHVCLRASGLRKEAYEFLSGEITFLATATMLLMSKALVGCGDLTLFYLKAAILYCVCVQTGGRT